MNTDILRIIRDIERTDGLSTEVWEFMHPDIKRGGMLIEAIENYTLAQPSHGTRKGARIMRGIISSFKPECFLS